MSKKPTRQWEPKCRAATLADRRTKRERTRADRERKAIEREAPSDEGVPKK